MPSDEHAVLGGDPGDDVRGGGVRSMTLRGLRCEGPLVAPRIGVYWAAAESAFIQKAFLADRGRPWVPSLAKLRVVPIQGVRSCA